MRQLLIDTIEQLSTFLEGSQDIVSFFADRNASLQLSQSRWRELIGFYDLYRRVSDQASQQNDVSYEFVALCEVLDELGSALLVLINGTKWWRSTAIPGQTDNYDEYVTVYGDTLEGIAQQNGVDWGNLALDNHVAQDDLLVDGGVVLRFRTRTSTAIPTAQVVYDAPIGSRMYGKDVDKALTIVDGQIQLLSPEHTVAQSARILSQLHKGDNPLYPNDGLDPIIASNRHIAAIAYTNAARNYSTLFATDDTFVNFSLNDIRIEGDSLSYELSIQTFGATIDISVPLTQQ